MNYMKQVAEMLGVELGEVFYLSGRDCKYRLEEEGLFYYGKAFFTEEEKWNCISGVSLLDGILTGGVNVEWRPKHGDFYWFIYPDELKPCEELYDSTGEEDRLMFKRGLVKRTEQEAIERMKELGWIE